jgi:hypothetical protein
VQLPDLKLLQFGYPFAAPQDLSTTTIALPATPSQTDLALMLAVSERLGRLSKANSVMLETYRVNQLPEEKRTSEHVIAIGTQSKFPFPEVLTAGDFALGSASSRRQQTSQIQALPDGEGVVKEVRSPWSEERVVLALSAQTDGGLAQVQNLFNQDSLFFQLQQDTALISANTVNPSPYETDDYTLEFLQQSTPQVVAIDPTLTGQLLGLFRGKWYVLIPGVVVSSLFIYGVAQVYLKRLDKFRNS